MCGNDLVNIGRSTALWHLHCGVKHRPLIAQVDSTYSICSPLVYSVGVKDAPLARLPKSIIMQRLFFDILIQWEPGCLFYHIFQSQAPRSPVWQPVVCYFSVPPANKLYVKLLWNERWVRLNIMDGFTDELMTGRQTSLTTEKNVSRLSLCLVTLMWILSWLMGKMVGRIGQIKLG